MPSHFSNFNLQSFASLGFILLPGLFKKITDTYNGHASPGFLSSINPDKISSFQSTGATDWNISSHCGPSPQSCMIREIIDSSQIHIISQKALSDAPYWIKCTRLYKQNIGFYMNWHHDSKNSKNSPNHKPGLVWLICLAPQPPVPFEILPGSHLISGDLERTSFKEKEVDDLFRRGVLTGRAESICLQPGDALVFDSRLIHRDNPSIKSQARFFHSFPSLSRELLFMQFTTEPSNVENIFLDIYSTHLASRPWWPANALDPYPMFPQSSIGTLPTSLTIAALLRLSLHLPRSIYSSMRRFVSILNSK